MIGLLHREPRFVVPIVEMQPGRRRKNAKLEYLTLSVSIELLSATVSDSDYSFQHLCNFLNLGYLTVWVVRFYYPSKFNQINCRN